MKAAQNILMQSIENAWNTGNGHAEVVLDYRQKGGVRLATLESMVSKGLIRIERQRGAHLGSLTVCTILKPRN